MNYNAFLKAIELRTPPEDPILRILYFDKIGEWNEAHDLADNSGGKHADRIHAYLHRREGDEWNSKYWYNRIQVDFPKISLDEEWELLTLKFCE